MKITCKQICYMEVGFSLKNQWSSQTVCSIKTCTLLLPWMDSERLKEAIWSKLWNDGNPDILICFYIIAFSFFFCHLRHICIRLGPQVCNYQRRRPTYILQFWIFTCELLIRLCHMLFLWRLNIKYSSLCDSEFY